VIILYIAKTCVVTERWHYCLLISSLSYGGKGADNTHQNEQNIP